MITTTNQNTIQETRQKYTTDNVAVNCLMYYSYIIINIKKKILYNKYFSGRYY